jgi:hypothetical protein
MMLAALNRTLWGFVWFLHQCIIVGGIGAIWFWVPAISLIVLLVIAIKRSPAEARKRFWWLAALPGMWIFIGLWGSYFWLDLGKHPVTRNPAWVSWPIDFGLWAFIAIAAALVFYLKNGRTFAVLFTALNLYFVLGMSFLAAMAVSGDWL